MNFIWDEWFWRREIIEQLSSTSTYLLGMQWGKKLSWNRTRDNLFFMPKWDNTNYLILLWTRTISNNFRTGTGWDNSQSFFTEFCSEKSNTIQKYFTLKFVVFMCDSSKFEICLLFKSIRQNVLEHLENLETKDYNFQPNVDISVLHEFKKLIY